VLSQNISKWLLEYLESTNLDCFIIGISGGIDSALVSTLCAQTGKKTLVVSMPIHQAQDQLQRAHNHIQWLKEKYSNVESFEFDLTNTFETFKSLFSAENKLALANSRSRLRMVTLYQIAGTYKGLVVGTGNKVEDFGVGFFTKYGDGGVDISPIADLTKTEVKQMAKELGVIEEILIAKPTDGLWEDDRTDEDQIGATYEELEWAMKYTPDDLNPLTPRDEEILIIYKKFNTVNQHKMVAIPIFKKQKI
jgi:NAD+ synthase